MAKCKFCSAEIPADSIFCTECGGKDPIASVAENATTETSAIAPKKNKKGLVIAIIAAIVALILIAGGVLLYIFSDDLFNKDNNNNVVSEEEDENSDDNDDNKETEEKSENDKTFCEDVTTEDITVDVDTDSITEEKTTYINEETTYINTDNEIDSDFNNNENDDKKTNFVFIVTHLDGSQKTFNISTTKTTVGEALIDAGLIAGEDSLYGLYVKTVDGETLSYDNDGVYWAFYIDNEYGVTDINMTTITEGSVYEFKAE